ncbi:MAG: DNA methyltransferase [Myxococcota bacterium]
MSARRRIAHDRPALSSALRGDETLAERLRAALARGGAVERYTHSFHTYPAGMHADAARDLVALFPGDSVFDPFCGGGTVLVEARASGRRAYGCDVSPVALRVARARCATPDEGVLTAFRSRARKLTELARHASASGAMPRDEVLRVVERWFAPHVLRELESLSKGIAASDESVRGLLEAVFSAIIVKVSYRASDTKAVREKHDRPAGTTAVLFHKKTRELARQLTELREALPPGTPEAELVLADAREARPTTPVALVLTSPPYPSTYDYLPMQHLRHVWLGERPDASLEIGARRLWRGGLRRAREIWRGDTDRWTANVAHTLVAGGQLVVVIGDGLLPSGIVDAAQPTLDAARRAGLELVAGASVERPEHAGLTNRREHAFAFRKSG